MRAFCIHIFMLVWICQGSFPKLLAQPGAPNKPKEYQQAIEAAEKHFINEDFFKAAQEYMQASKSVNGDQYADLRTAECLRLNFDLEEAEIMYEKCTKFYPNADPMMYFWYGIMQKSNGKYSDAEISFQTFLNRFKAVSPEQKYYSRQADVELKGCKFALKMLDVPAKDINLQLLPFPVNTKNSEFSPVLYAHDTSLIITSARADAKGHEHNTASGESRTDNFRYEKKGERWLRVDNADNFDVLNTNNDDGAGELTKDKKKYYYTICDPECGIYVSRVVNGKFTKAERLNANINAGIWNAQPSINPRGDTMYFVSKRDGGRGLTDIWVSINKDKSGNKEDWQPARNLLNINTSGVEIAPFWDHESQYLYFASNGHVGFGGIDIFKTRITKVDSISNLGLPYNSNMDDYFLVLGKQKGYLVSNRYGGYGLGDIYGFDRYAKPSVSVLNAFKQDYNEEIESVTSLGNLYYETTNAAVVSTSVFLKNERGEVVKEAITNSMGEFRFENLPPDKNFRIVINSNDPNIRAKVKYIPNKSGIVEGRILLNEDKTPQTTPSDSKVSPTAGAEPIAADTDEKDKKYKYVARRMFAENVYFDYNSPTMFPSGKTSLDQIADFLKNKQKVQVEIKAFTDALGQAEYNTELARQRALECFQYLVSKGVDQTSLLMIPAGEAKPIGSNNSYIGRQLNRRVEITVIGAEENYSNQYMVYIVEPKMTLFSIAKKFGMAVEELQQINNLSPEQLKAYMPLLVKKNQEKIYISNETLMLLKEGKGELRFENGEFKFN